MVFIENLFKLFVITIKTKVMNAIHNFFLQIFHFRNSSHEYWFYVTMFMFVIFSILSFVKKDTVFLYSLSFGFIGVAISAVFVVCLKIPSYVYSVDCIWYNSLLSLFYFIVILIIKKKRSRL